MQLLSQRDLKWASVKLGTGTISDRGCTITALAMLLGTTPDVLASKCRFTADGAIYWDSVSAVGGQFVFRGYVYDNNAVLSAIKNAGGCLVEVKAANQVGGKHWVLYTGNQKLYDPWDGKEKSTSTYPSVTGYAYIKPLNRSISTPLTLPGTVSGGGVTLTKISEQDAKTGVYRII
jgi:hypothetical protein